jgi:hypothetical protein
VTDGPLSPCLRTRQPHTQSIVRVALLFVLTLVASGCGRSELDLTSPAAGGSTTAPPEEMTTEGAGPMSVCDPTSCTGCCGTAGQCLAGTAPSACGSGGSACAICPGGTCSGGVCGSTVVLFGGATALLGALDDTWTFNGSSWTQVSVSRPPPARAAMMATLGNEVVLFGGVDADLSTYRTDTWTFDGTS